MKTKQYIMLVLFCMTLSGLQAQELNQLDKSGKRHGAWKGYFEKSHSLRYEGTFDHGKETGTFTFYVEGSGKTVMATREFNDKDGTAYTIFYDAKKNKVSEGREKNKRYDGEWKYYHKASPKVMTLEFYANGKLEGKRQVFYPNGEIAEDAEYKNGLKDGNYKRYSAKGIVIEEAVYKAGEYNGPTIYRDDKNQITVKGQFKDGKKNGIWQYYEDNKLIKEENMSQVKKSQKAVSPKKI